MHPRSCDWADDVDVDLAKDTDQWSLFNTGDILLRFGEAAGLTVSDGGGSKLHAVDHLCGALQGFDTSMAEDIVPIDGGP
jgi:hypothetical protein